MAGRLEIVRVRVRPILTRESGKVFPDLDSEVLPHSGPLTAALCVLTSCSGFISFWCVSDTVIADEETSCTGTVAASEGLAEGEGG